MSMLLRRLAQQFVSKWWTLSRVYAGTQLYDFILKRPTSATVIREAALTSQNRRNNRAAKHGLPGIDATL